MSLSAAPWVIREWLDARLAGLASTGPVQAVASDRSVEWVEAPAVPPLFPQGQTIRAGLVGFPPAAGWGEWLRGKPGFAPEVIAFSKGQARAWEQIGFPVAGEFKPGLDLACVVPARQRAEGLALTISAARHLKPGGWLVFSCPNDLGAKGYAKHWSNWGWKFEVVTDKRCRMLAHQITGEPLPQLAQDIPLIEPMQPPDCDGLWSMPGLFSWEKIDNGSALLIEQLAQHFPEGLHGRVLDLGCGYGFLSHEVLFNSPQVKKLTALEIDSRALICAKKNLAPFADKVAIDFLWEEAEAWKPEPVHDFVIMNAPFHAEKPTDVDLALAFVRQAAAALKVGGQLICVANQFLPYEHVVEELFGERAELFRGQGYKVLTGRKMR